MSRASILSSAVVALSAFLLSVPDRAPAAPLIAVEKTDDTAFFGAMRDADLRLATIAWRLATANAAICPDRAPTPGIVIHAIDQYDPGVRKDLPAIFGFEGPVAVESAVGLE